MAGKIHITNDFPSAREKVVLLELLNIMRALKEENIDAIVCTIFRLFYRKNDGTLALGFEPSLEGSVLPSQLQLRSLVARIHRAIVGWP